MYNSTINYRLKLSIYRCRRSINLHMKKIRFQSCANLLCPFSSRVGFEFQHSPHLDILDTFFSCTTCITPMHNYLFHYRYSKIETLLMAHNWHWVSSIGTNVKNNIFYPMTSANFNRKKNYSQHCFKHDGIYKYYYLFLF